MPSARLSSMEGILRERVKELTCLCAISQSVTRPGLSRDEILLGILEHIPAAWQYPEVASARTILDGHVYASCGFREGRQRQSAEIVVGGIARGTIEVHYSEARPEVAEGPFLTEERNLLGAIAKQVALILDCHEAEQERLRYRDQLWHADRLATIGQLAAGVAHELNEPLANILGFAQLAQKTPSLPHTAKEDIRKIEAASLQAREIIKKLLVFARQSPPQTKHVNLNQVIEEGRSFFSSRCAKQDVELQLALEPDLPDLLADPTQLYQALVNLVVNALHAMPEGGRLLLRTERSGDRLVLSVEDTGVGMSDEVVGKIFAPFFTTKDVGEGTGLGLPVVHGIVSAHGGSIKVESKEGQGTRFEISLPLVRPDAVRENR